MKTFSLLAVAVACVAMLAPSHAQNVLTATADAANTTEPQFLPGVGTPEGLDGSADGSSADAGKEDDEAPAMVKAAGSAMDGSMDKMETKPAPTGSNSSVPTPAPTTSAAPSAMVGAGVAVAAVSVFSVALL